MTADTGRATLKLIHQSFADAAGKSAAYRHILPFFETLYTLQEAAVETPRHEPVRLDSQTLDAKRKAHPPLWDRRDLPMDHASAADLLKALCSAADKGTETLRHAATAICACLHNGEDDLHRGYQLLLEADDEGMKRIGRRIGVDVHLLNFFLYNSLFPAIARHTRRLAECLGRDESRETGYCPICGGMPNLSYLDENGGRFLVCHFCRYQWPVKRNLCPVCHLRGIETPGYFFSESEKAYRVYTCEACKSYLKTVDTRELARPLYPPLENLITTHLDLQAGQKGYRPTVSQGPVT